MRIGTPGERSSDRIMRKMVAGRLGIAETETERLAANGCGSCGHSAEKTASDCSCEDCPCSGKEAARCASGCPECGAAMQVRGNMERCAGCGYATASEEGKETLSRTASATKKASETSILAYLIKEATEDEAAYYKKIFPDEYANELTGKPDSGKPGEKVEYSSKPADGKVSARRRHAEHEAGQCEVPDAHPEQGASAGSGATELPDPKWQSGDSANSISGPEKVKEHGGHVGGEPGEAGDVSEPDLGVPSKAARRVRADGRIDLSEHGANSVDGPTPPKPKAQSANADGGQVSEPDLGIPSKGADRWIDRKLMAVLCPPCAREMQACGIKRVRASWLSSQLAKQADRRGINRR